MQLDFIGRVALVTGSGRGLGREHALMLAARGCKVVVNDLLGAGRGSEDGLGPDVVVAEIIRAGGEAVANYDSVLSGEAVVQAALDAYGRLDIVVNNAGILTPEPWRELGTESWERTLAVNLTGVFSVMKAAWPVFVAQKYGRAVMTCSPALFGAGVSAYAASKAAQLGLAASLQFEALKLKTVDIKVNNVIPQADTRMTRDFGTQISMRRKGTKQPQPQPQPQPQQQQQQQQQQGITWTDPGPASEGVRSRMAPGNVSAMVVWLCHESCDAAATVHEAGAGYFAQLRWQRSAPLFVTEVEGVSGPPQPEHVHAGQATLADFHHGDIPESGGRSMGGPSALDRVLRHVKQAAAAAKL
eukprot:COSAG01_NODE_6321_length_3720_cov_9.879296_2_plen_357_part_00